MGQYATQEGVTKLPRASYFQNMDRCLLFAPSTNVAEFSHEREKWEEGERQAADALSYVAADQICGRNCLFHKTEFI